MGLMEEKLLSAARGMEEEKETKETGEKKKVDTLKEKYKEEGGKVYEVTTTVQVDDDTEEEFSYLFRKPKPASYDRYVKTISNSVTKASKSFVFDNIVEEQKGDLKKTMEEYPAITISLADKLLRMLGLADTTSVKKL